MKKIISLLVIIVVLSVIWNVLKYTDFCAINEIEAESITGIRLYEKEKLPEENMEEALYCMKKMGVQKWIVIHSPLVSYGMDVEKHQIVRTESLKLPKDYIKGTTGAGDAYCCGFLYGAYRGDSLSESMKLGTACAACSLSEMGGAMV